ncbi:MAG: hypothetical protein IPM33_00575 [Phycisphaerales bacterium]|nr:hypothetical protein [Phycisphaerales bacterium]
MPTHHALAFFAALAGSCAGVFGQDSVSRNANGGNGMPGDAISPWSSGLGQRANYVVDLTEFRTASGVRLGIGPLAKSGKTSAGRFTALNATSGLSQTVRTGAAFPNPTYTLWSQAGGGLNTSENNTSLNSTLTPAGSPSVFGLGFLDVDEILVGSTPVFVNQVVGAMVAFDPGEPSRLYVTRSTACVNSTFNQTDRSQFGFGAIDADGNLYLRADSFGSAGPATSLLQGDNYFRVRLPARSVFANLIDNNGASNAPSVDWVLQRHAVTHACPNAIPQDQASRPVVMGADFLGQYRYESTAGSTTTTNTHRPATTDQRGGMTYSAVRLFAGSVGTGAVLSRGAAGGGKTDTLSLYGVGSDGQVVGTRGVTIPPSIADSCDAFVWPLAGGEFRNYESQVTFRGGSGPVAVGRDLGGLALAAGVLYAGTNTGAANPSNAIVACRFDAGNPQSTPEWTSVAWVDAASMTGKAIRGDYGADGAPGTNDTGEGDGVVDANDAPIGRLAAMNESTLGPSGPSLSGPAFDAAGNVYFLASVALRERVGPSIVTRYDIALLRGVLDRASFCYTLDLVARTGDVFRGSNSATDYRIAALSVADADSVASGAVWSSSAMQQAWNGIDASALPAHDPAHLGGLVLSARIVYDTNGDLLFEDPTLAGGNANSVDEAYNVALYIGNITPPSLCVADYNGSGGTPDDADVAAFFDDWNNGDPRSDINNSGGTPDDADVFYFFIRWNEGC